MKEYAFFQEYKEDTNTKTKNGRKQLVKADCGEKAIKEPTDSTQLCKINEDEIFQGDCTKDNHYGFKKGKPCIAIKLNRVRAFTYMTMCTLWGNIKTSSKYHGFLKIAHEQHMITSEIYHRGTIYHATVQSMQAYQILFNYVQNVIRWCPCRLNTKLSNSPRPE